MAMPHRMIARRALRALMAYATAAFLSGTPASATTESRPAPKAIDLNKPYDARDYAFVGDAVGASMVVGLGESIHLTRQMPRVRLNLLRSLHENKGFSTLALEGSLIEAWTAQENAYRSTAPLAERARTFTREALFGLWQTDEMEQVIAYALSTQGGPKPLYLASFDIQPGNARAYGGSGEQSLRAFLLALSRLDNNVGEEQISRWSKSLGPAIACESETADAAALKEMEAWILGSASAAAARQRPPVHVAALRLAPNMLRARLGHCKSWQAAERDMRVYQESRDVVNARLVLALLQTSPKMLLWAHHSHLNHNSLRKAVPSMGQHLKSTLGDQLYTIGVFAHRGAAADTSKADAAEGAGIVLALAARPIPDDERFGVENRLASLAKTDFFLDLENAPADWARPSFSRMETEGRLPTALSRDFDGAVLLHRVDGAEMNFLPSPLRFLINGLSWIYQHAILAALIALMCVGAVVWAIRRLWRRRRLRRKLAT